MAGMLHSVETFLRKLRRGLSRSEWLIQLLRLRKTQGAASEPGLVLIQIDGLSRPQMEAAMAKGHLPFLSQLLREQRYRLHSLYSGLPSSTPAVMAELLYGVKCAVPAFSFYDASRRKVLRMYEAEAAKDLDRRLRGQGPPLLAGGSAYAGIYTGGAAETHFCAAMMGLDDLFRARYPLRLLIILLFSIYSLLRVAVLLVIEFALALVDFVRGLIAGQDLWKELKFVPSRVGVAILMRELATIGAEIDVTRGLPVVFLDFVGYDEQSHRRGPTSRFAHWSLKGIDGAVRRVWKSACRSGQRDYDVWIYSDHGNEDVTPYPHKSGRSIRQAVSEVFDGQLEFGAAEAGRGVQSRRMRSYMFKAAETSKPGRVESPDKTIVPRRHEPVVAAMGPVGHVYIDEPLDPQERDRLSRALVRQAGIPMVTVTGDAGTVRGWNALGPFTLPDDAAAVFAPGHPFLEEMTEDFIRLCHHHQAGDFVLWGWNRGGALYTFPIENGAHAGPGLEETHAFAVLPEDTPLSHKNQRYLRPLEIREAAMHHLGRHMGPLPPAASVKETSVLRVMTYNIHNCLGIDGKLSPRRIARVIARYRPDVVALQEVDLGRARTERADQAKIIAEHLRMEHHFHPTIQVQEEAYGDCILSRLPMRLVKTGMLPTLPDRHKLERRGAIWVEVEWNGRTVHLVNTHLGLYARERLRQVDALLGDEWLGGLDDRARIALCGDFNAIPQSRVWRRCTEVLRDAQTSSGRPPRRTWFGRFPLARIDHIFINADLEVAGVEVGDDDLARIASDHRPVVASLRLRS